MSNIPEDIKKTIDNMSYSELLSRWRFGSLGDPMFQGEVGDYFAKLMFKKREEVDHVAASKAIGWDKGTIL